VRQLNPQEESQMKKSLSMVVAAVILAVTAISVVVPVSAEAALTFGREKLKGTTK
jgi:hypothetical protein